MPWEIPKFLHPILLRGYKEFHNNEKDVTPDEERTMLARLVCAFHIKYLYLSEYKDFASYDKTRSKLILSSSLVFVFFLVVTSIFAHGLLNFIRIGSEDDDLKPLVLQAIFTLSTFLDPYMQVIIYSVQYRNMIKLMNKYMNTCKGISDNIKEFYKLQTLRRHFIQYFIQIDTVMGFTYHYVHRSNCFDNDPRLICGLFVPMWLPFVTNYFPVREILVIVFTTLFTHLCIYLLSALIDIFFLGELYEYKVKELIKMIRGTSLSREQNIDIVRSKFRRIVDNHQKLYECFILTRDIAAELTLIIFYGFVPYTASLMTFVVTDFNVAHLDEFLVIFTTLYMWIHGLQKINDMNEMLPEVVYEMDWYEMDNRMRKDFIIFYMKLQQPMEIKSAFFILKKPIFVSMMKTIYSILMLLLRR